MSDATASLIGSGVSQQLQQTGQASPSATAVSADGVDNGFSAVFQDVIGQGEVAQDAEGSASAGTAAGQAIMPLDAFIVNGLMPIDTEMLTGQTIDPAAMMLPTAMAVGNELPPAVPNLSWAGYVAYADNNGAAAKAYLGDGEVMIQTPTNYAPQLPGSIQRSQQQIQDFLSLPPTTVSLNNQPVLAAQTSDFMTQLMSLNKDRQLTEIAAIHTPPQSGTGAFSTHFSPTALTDLSQQVSSGARAGDPIQVMPQHPNWGQELGNRVQWMVGRQMQSADIRLNPPELGSLEVRIQLQGDQATVNFSSPHGVVRDAIDAALPRLREMLAESGLNLADVNVSSQSHGQGEQRANESGTGGKQNADKLESIGPEQAGDTHITPLSSSSMLDVFA